MLYILIISNNTNAQLNIADSGGCSFSRYLSM